MNYICFHYHNYRNNLHFYVCKVVKPVTIRFKHQTQINCSIYWLDLVRTTRGFNWLCGRMLGRSY